jgi:hypothetical protein
MKFLKEKHLRVKSPITIDGLTLAYDAFQRPRYNITHLPITAKPHLEKANKKLPQHLKKIIEVIDPIETNVPSVGPKPPKIPSFPPAPKKEPAEEYAFDELENTAQEIKEKPVKEKKS